MNIKDEHTSRLWTFIMKGEIMDLDDDELIATRVNNKTASWKEVEEYIEKNYISKDKVRDLLEQFRAIKKEILKLEHELGRASITYDIVRNDYCEKMLEKLLGE